MKKIKRFLKTLPVIVAFFATPAFAQSYCADRDSVISRLAITYGETQIWIGSSDNQKQVSELWENEEKETWTFMTTDTTNKTCIIASGTGSSGLGRMENRKDS